MLRIWCLLSVFFYAAPLFAETADSGSAGTVAEEIVIDIPVVDSTAVSADKETDSDPLLAPEVMPKLTSFVKADYPGELVKQGIEGTVMLELLVNEAGRVDSVAVVTGINHVLDSCAMRAAARFVFSPAMAEGEPVPVLLQYAYRFTLDEVVDSLRPYCNFSGICIEKGTKRPIADAVVSVSFSDTTTDTTLPLPFGMYLKKIGGFAGQQLDEGHIIVTTDSVGAFQYFSLPGCSISVSIIVPGYSQYSTTEVLARDEHVSVKYYVERYSYSEYEVVVYGKAEKKEVARRQLTINEVRRIPGLGGDAIKVIQALPGVARPLMGGGEVIVRGAPSWDSRYFLDGMEMPILYHFGMKSTYNSEALSSIDFYPGGFNTRYGGAIGGIVEIEGRKGTSERLKGVVELSSLDGSVFLEGPIHDSITFVASARRSFIGEVVREIFEMFPEQFPYSVYPFYWDYLLRGDIPVKKYGDFSLVFFGSRDSLSFIYPRLRFDDNGKLKEESESFGTNSTFNMGILGWDIEIGRRWKNTLRYQLMNFYYNYHSVFGRYYQDAWVNHIRDQITCTLSDKVHINFGADAQWSNVDVSFAFLDENGVPEDSLIPDWRFGDIAAYMNVEWKPIEKLQIIPGLRYDYYPELMYDGSIVPAFWKYQGFDNYRGFSGEPSLRLTTRYEIIENHTAKIALGTYNQTPEPMGEVIMENWGDPMTPATKAAHYVGGYEWQITDLINLDAQVYFNKQWDIPGLVTADDIAAGSDPGKLYKHDGMGRMYGLELMLRHQQGERFFGWLAYTLSRSERYNRHEQEWELFSADETHNIQLLGNLKLRRNWEMGVRLRYTSGKPTTPVVGVEESENSTGDFTSPYFKPIYGEKFSERFDPFFQFDFRIDKKIVFRKWMFSLFIDLQNLSYFVYKSPEMKIPSYDYSENIEISNIPMFALGFRGEF